MKRIRMVAGKEDLVFTVEEVRLPDFSFRTVSIEGKIRVVPGREPHSGGDRSAFDHHGHLIADEFGGPGSADSGNIVAMHGHANNGAGGQYRAMERAIKKCLGDREGWMRVEVGYQGESDWRPHVFEVRVKYQNGMHSRWKIFNFYPNLMNPYLKPGG